MRPLPEPFVALGVIVFVGRQDVEEQALRAGLGDVYRDYMRRIRRLIPWVY
jgi:protein-S-isoprenylcysteine O-methyltransferase Ste14